MLRNDFGSFDKAEPMMRFTIQMETFLEDMIQKLLTGYGMSMNVDKIARRNITDILSQIHIK